MRRGFTLIEVVLALAIMFIIASVVVGVFSHFNRSVVLQTEAGKIASLIYKARSDTLASRGDVQHGVHFESDRVILFQGESYSAGAVTNEIFPLGRSVSISNINLSGGGSDVVFQRLTGSTSMPGSVILTLLGEGGLSTTINISVNGLVTIE